MRSRLMFSKPASQAATMTALVLNGSLDVRPYPVRFDSWIGTETDTGEPASPELSQACRCHRLLDAPQPSLSAVRGQTKRVFRLPRGFAPADRG